jgi:hypothetical protein
LEPGSQKTKFYFKERKPMIHHVKDAGGRAFRVFEDGNRLICECFTFVFKKACAHVDEVRAKLANKVQKNGN